MKGTSVAAFVAVMALAGCDVLFVDADPTTPAVQFSLAPSLGTVPELGDLSAALARVRRAHFRFGSGDAMRDTSVAAGLVRDTLRAGVSIRGEEGQGWLEVHVELRSQDESRLFEGQGLVWTYDVSPRVTVDILPVAGAIVTSTDLTFEALGDTVPIEVVVQFEDGETIAGAPVSAASSDPAIVTVLTDGAVVSRDNGTSSVTVSSLGRSIVLPARVRQRPFTLTGIGPADTTVASGDSFQARAFGRDGNGYPLLTGADVSWSVRGGVLSVDSMGIVTAVGTGTGFVDATVGPVTRSAQVEVTP